MGCFCTSGHRSTATSEREKRREEKAPATELVGWGVAEGCALAKTLRQKQVGYVEG